MSPKSVLISIALMAATSVMIGFVSVRGTPSVVSINLDRIPITIGDYRGTDDRFDPSVYKELNADHHVYRHYLASDGRQVDLYIGYYGTAKGGRTGHNPYACLPGAGWGIVKRDKVALSPPYLKQPVEVNYIRAVKGNHVESVLHWYQSSGTKVLPSGFAQNLHRFVSRVFFNRNDGAFVRVSTVTSMDHIDKADAQTFAFAQDVISLLPAYWPEEREL